MISSTAVIAVISLWLLSSPMTDASIERRRRRKTNSEKGRILAATSKVTNDDACNARGPINEFPAKQLRYSTIGATKQKGEIGPPNQKFYNTVWYAVRPKSNCLNVGTNRPDSKLHLTVFQAAEAPNCSSFGEMILVANSPAMTALKSVRVHPDQLYYLQLSSYKQRKRSKGKFWINTCELPVNDNPQDATSITVPGNTAFSTKLATALEGEVVPGLNSSLSLLSSCGEHDCAVIREQPVNAEHSIWYTVVAPPSGVVNIDTTDDSHPVQLALWRVKNSSDFSTYSLVAAATSLQRKRGGALLHAIPLNQGETFYLQVDGYKATGNLTISECVPPANDSPCNAQLVTIGNDSSVAPSGVTVAPYNLTCATVQAKEASPGTGSASHASCWSRDGWCAEDPGVQNSVWFRFTPSSEECVSIGTDTYLDNTQIALWRLVDTTPGGCERGFRAFHRIAANDDSGPGQSPVLSGIQVVANQEYYIQVDGYMGALSVGNIWIEECSPPDNDDPCGATDLTVPGRASFDTRWATTLRNEVSPGVQSGSSSMDGWPRRDANRVQNSVWFRFASPYDMHKFKGCVHLVVDTQVMRETGAAAELDDVQIALYKVNKQRSGSSCSNFGSFELLRASDGKRGLTMTGISYNPNEEFYIQLDGYLGRLSMGTITIEECKVQDDRSRLACFRPDGRDLRAAIADYMGRDTYASATHGASIGDWCVNHVQDFSHAFEHAHFNAPLRNWKTTSATNLNSMFRKSTFNQAVSHFQVNRVVDLGSFAEGAQFFNQPLKTWRTGSAVTMHKMFAGATKFDQPLAHLDVRNVTNFERMLDGATKFQQDVCQWGLTLKQTTMYRSGTAEPINVKDMFSGTACPNRDDPQLQDKDVPGPCCMGCNNGCRQLNQQCTRSSQCCNTMKCVKKGSSSKCG